MITNYVSEVIRLFVVSTFFSKEDLQDLICMPAAKMEKLLEGDDEQLDANNLNCFTKAFGMDAFNYSFLSEIFSDNYRHSEVHKSLSHNNQEVKNIMNKIWAISGEGNKQLMTILARTASNKCYIRSCQLMIDCLKEAGMFEEQEAEETEEVMVEV